MAADKLKPSLADYVTLAISPALIMAMIDSLVFFLLALCYRGEYAGRLHYILFFYVFGMVLVARISMEAGLSGRAPLYGSVLAVLVWLGMGNFVTYPRELAAASWFINACLVALAWWLAYQLTYSCTYIDEKAEATGTGMLDAARLETANGAENPSLGGKRGKKPADSWWRRFRSFREERRKKQPPGLWVVYFGLAALPIFGLGQVLIDVGDRERRARTFWLMTGYLASSLGLLMTTAFLGLRRYLRQRRVGMPPMVTLAWLVLGAVLIAVFVGLGASLPRPQAEVTLLGLSAGEQHKSAASNYAVTQGEPGEGEGRAGAQQHDPEGAPAAGKDKNRAGSGGKGQARGRGDGPKRQEPGNTRNAGQDAARQDADSAKPNPARAEQRQADPAQTGESGGDAAVAPPLSWVTSAMTALKWIVLAILGLIILFFLLRGGLRYLAHFTEWARQLLEALRRFWEGLFGTPQRGRRTGRGFASVPEPTHRPFSDYGNPFQSGRANRMTPAELVRYTFEALEAWADERDHARRLDESPIEFTGRLLAELPVLGRDVQAVGVLYARVLYAPGELPAGWNETLRSFWNRLSAMPSGEPVVLAR
jgi:hypothetical protein